MRASKTAADVLKITNSKYFYFCPGLHNVLFMSLLLSFKIEEIHNQTYRQNCECGGK